MKPDELTLKKDWAEFWASYPKKVSKLAAEKAYRTARIKRQASAQDLLSGLAAYIVHKPEWQEWANGASWLNAGGWMNDYNKPAPAQKPVPLAYRPYVPLRLRTEGEA
jgi:hypothetical protein